MKRMTVKCFVINVLLLDGHFTKMKKMFKKFETVEMQFTKCLFCPEIAQEYICNMSPGTLKISLFLLLQGMKYSESVFPHLILNIVSFQVYSLPVGLCLANYPLVSCIMHPNLINFHL